MTASPVPTRVETEQRPGAVAGLLIVVISGYRRFVSPFLGARCRFHPSCSAYAVTALQVHGAGRGGWLAVRRVGRCHPWNPGGYDPVPPRSDARASAMTPGATRC
jgi:uncharacterized protein